jgi:MYND finger
MLLAAEQHAEAAAQAAAAAAASATAVAVLSNVAELRSQMHTRVLAAAVAVAAAATVKAGEALTAEAATLQALHGEQDLQCGMSVLQPATAAAVSTSLTDSDVDNDDDCPLLMHAAMLSSSSSAGSGMSNEAAAASKMTAAEPAAAVAAPMSTITAASASCGSARVSGTAVNTVMQQHKQTVQQPCVQCGKMTKKRCRRCQTVHYCSEECQIECFKDPEHRAACEVAAAAAAALIH